MTMNEYYFQTRGLTVGYNGKPLIRDICLHLRRGEILTLIGPNGTGKTTILKSIIRQLSLLGGVVSLNGQDLARIPGSELAKQLSVVLTQRLNTELMTCRDVVATGRYPYTGRFGVLSKEDWIIVQDSMELVHVDTLADMDFSHLSDGQRQRVLLARALCQQPEILVLDEPTSYLDIRYKLEFLSILQQLSRERELTVILSLHEVDLAQRISHRVACIRGDRVERFGPPEEIFVPGYIESLYQVQTGNYDAHTGSLELARPNGEPQVFVLAGGGYGAPVFRRLQREGIPFSTGILWKNDVDYPVARGLAADIISLPAFAPITEEHLARAREEIGRCSHVILALPRESMTGFSAPLTELADYAAGQNKLK